MNELPSAEFRKSYAKLTEPTVVTVNGHVIGTWTPMQPVAHQMGKVAEGKSVHEAVAMLPGGGVQARQAQRDALLGKINRSK